MANSTVWSAIAQGKYVSPFDIQDPKWMTELYQSRGDQLASAMGLIEMMGATEAIGRNQWTQYEQDFLSPILNISVAPVVVSAPAGTFSFIPSNTANTNDYLAGSVVAPYSSTAVYVNPAIVGQRLIFSLAALANVRATVTNVASPTTNTAVVTFQVTNAADIATVTAQLANLAATPVWIVDNAHADGTDQPNGQIPGILSDVGYTQIIKTSFNVFGGLSTDDLKVKKFTDGKGIEGYTSIGMQQLNYLHQKSIGNALLFERPSDNPVIDANGEYAQTTEGLGPYINRKGLTLTNPAGTWSVALQDQLEKFIDQQLPGTNTYCMLAGIGAIQAKNQTYKTYFNNTDISYVRGQVLQDYFKGNAGFEASVNFQYFKQSHITFCWQTCPEFNDPRGAGMSTTSGYQDTVFGFPMGMKSITYGGQTIKLPFFGMKYKANNGYSRKAEVVNLMGATNGQHQISQDINKYGYKSEIGASHVAGNAMFRIN